MTFYKGDKVVIYWVLREQYVPKELTIGKKQYHYVGLEFVVSEFDSQGNLICSDGQSSEDAITVYTKQVSLVKRPIKNWLKYIADKIRDFTFKYWSA